MNKRATATLMTMLAATQSAGCYFTWDIAPSSMKNLNGFRHFETRELRTTDNKVVEFTSDTELTFAGNDELRAKLRFGRVKVEGSILTGNELDSYEELKVDLTRVKTIQATNRSIVGTTTGIVVASAVVGGGVVLGLLTLGAMAGIGAGGRPLRRAGQTDPERAFLQFAPTIDKNVGAHGVNDATKARLFAFWADEASAECASIPAFLALARDLKRAGAPMSLVEHALRAAREEARHTELCTTLANAHAPLPIFARPPETPANADVDHHSLVRRLALESFWDGCIAEGVAASVARRSAHRAKDVATRNALLEIAHDEQAHADLAKHILAYCLSAGGQSIRNALLESIEAKRADEEGRMHLDDEPCWLDQDEFDEDIARAHGLSARDARQAARAEVWEKAIAFWGH